MTIPSDTSSEMDDLQRQLLREKSPSERLCLALRLSSDVITASKRAIARVHPEWTEQEIAHRFIEMHYGHALAAAVLHYAKERANAATK